MRFVLTGSFSNPTRPSDGDVSSPASAPSPCPASACIPISVPLTGRRKFFLGFPHGQPPLYFPCAHFGVFTRPTPMLGFLLCSCWICTDLGLYKGKQHKLVQEQGNFTYHILIWSTAILRSRQQLPAAGVYQVATTLLHPPGRSTERCPTGRQLQGHS
jgi:hypothetical protein